MLSEEEAVILALPVPMEVEERVMVVVAADLPYAGAEMMWSLQGRVVVMVVVILLLLAEQRHPTQMALCRQRHFRAAPHHRCRHPLLMVTEEEGRRRKAGQQDTMVLRGPSIQEAITRVVLEAAGTMEEEAAISAAVDLRI